VAILETQSGEGTYWKNQYIQIHVGSGARLTHYRLSKETSKGNRTEYIDIALDRDAYYQGFIVQKGADHAVSDIHVALQQEGSECVLNQITLLEQQQLNDTRFLVHHQAPHTNSVQNVRTIVNDRGNGIFQGKVHVDAIAQKTDGSQSSKALLLSNTAQMNTKPELEIYADDVKCAHGATTGQIDKDQLFYLKSRGIPHDQAMAILVEAFCMEILEQIPDEDTRTLFIQEVGKWLTA
jgi:Fe-S cluster assembly protein SufD